VTTQRVHGQVRSSETFTERHSLVRYVWEVSDSNPIQQNNLISVLVCFTWSGKCSIIHSFLK